MKFITYILITMSALTATAQETPILENYTLKNGLKVYFIKYGKIEAMSISVMINSGKKNEAPGQQGYNNLAANLLLKGNKKYTEDQQVDKAFAIGTELRTGAGFDFTTIEADLLSKDAETAFDLLSAAILQPVYDKDKVSQYVSYLIDYNNPVKMDISAMARIYSHLGIYGVDNPLGRTVYKQHLQQVTPEKLVEFHQFNYTPKNTRVVVCGNFNSEEVKNIIETNFGAWQSTYGEVNGVSLDPPSIKKTEVAFANRTGATQCALEWNKNAPSTNDKNYAAFYIANQLFNQTLFKEIREIGGKTYSIGSSHVSTKFANLISIACSVRSNEMLNTIKLFDKTLTMFANAAFTKQEFDNEITGYKARLMSMENPSQVLDFYNPVLFNFEQRKNMSKMVEALKMENVQKVIKKYYTPDSYKLVISGDEITVKDQLVQIKNLRKYSPADLEIKVVKQE